MLNLPLNVEIQKKMDFTFEEPRPPFSFNWLYEEVSYPVFPEYRGTKIYWYMRKMIDRETFKIYVAPAGKLSAELLNNAAKQIAVTASPVKQNS